MNHSLETQVDELIDATLTTLRNTPPPTGLEDRLLHSLVDAQEQATMRVPHVPRLGHGWITLISLRHLWLPSSLVATILAIVFAIHLHLSFTPTSTLTTTATVKAPSTPASPDEPVILSEAQRSRRTPKPSTNLSRPNLSPLALSLTTPYEQAALDDAFAPSHPAPPIPLTGQERLLLRILRHGDYIELAELNPATRSALDAQQTAAFQNFFTPPPPENPGDKQ